MKKTVLGLALLAMVVGCGPGGAGGQAGAVGCEPAPNGGGIVSWMDNATPMCATLTTVVRQTDSILDVFDLSASKTLGDVLGEGLRIYLFMLPSEGRLVPGTYDCMPETSTRAVLFSYRGSWQSCTITLIDPGITGVTHTIGTFNAVTNNFNGATTYVTEGYFDVATM